MNKESTRYSDRFAELIDFKKEHKGQTAPVPVYIDLSEPGVDFVEVTEKGTAVFEIPTDAEKLDPSVSVVICDTVTKANGDIVATAFKCMGCFDWFIAETADSDSFCPKCGRPIGKVWGSMSEYMENKDKQDPGSELDPELIDAIRPE